jgi:hypothetical protein
MIALTKERIGRVNNSLRWGGWMGDGPARGGEKRAYTVLNEQTVQVETLVYASISPPRVRPLHVVTTRMQADRS